MCHSNMKFKFSDELSDLLCVDVCATILEENWEVQLPFSSLNAAVPGSYFLFCRIICIFICVKLLKYIFVF